MNSEHGKIMDDGGFTGTYYLAAEAEDQSLENRFMKSTSETKFLRKQLMIRTKHKLEVRQFCTAYLTKFRT
jgi:hypothetical protein